MSVDDQQAVKARKALQRIYPRVTQLLKERILADPDGWAVLQSRLETYFPTLFSLYYELYQPHYDFIYHLEDLVTSVGRAWFDRGPALRALDEAREKNPVWFQSHEMLGGVCYVDLFAGNLEGIRASIPYFQELGLTYLHLMPLFKRPAVENDGGYAVSSYREVHPPLGSMAQLADLAAALREANISLAVDLVFNHTSDEHPWAMAAKAGEEAYQDFYYIFPDRMMPDQYERFLREIFPEEHSGTFTFFPDIVVNRQGTVSDTEVADGRHYGDSIQRSDTTHPTLRGGWVWTTFHSYQWDLNYANPAVFNRMAEEMLFLANQGVEVLRLDAVAFIWKQLGTNCENLPEAHALIRAFNAIARIAAPALIFKSEAIVHPDEVVKYISPAECQISYNPLLMALLWNSLATREVSLLSQALATRFNLHAETAWVNYVRVHDDIGWTFSDQDAALLGINGFDHRRFLNDFYRGDFPGSFARGLPFQENLQTGDCRISGTCASLAGLEKALREEGPAEVALAISRIHLIYGVVLLAGGIPLIYLGDEIGMVNDNSYLDHTEHQDDSRWVHRFQTDWQKVAQRNDPKSVEGRVFQGLKALIEIRKKHAVFSGGALEVFWTENVHVLGFMRYHAGKRCIVLANFSEGVQVIPERILVQGAMKGKKKLHGKSRVPRNGDLALQPLDLLVLG